MAETVRLQKFMAQKGLASRREAERLIDAKLVKVNGKVVTGPGLKVDPDTAIIEIDTVGAAALVDNRVIVLNKPVGYVTSKGDGEGKTILDLLPENAQGLSHAGRLDKDSRGLVLMVGDGRLSFAITKPENHLEKEYIVTVNKNVGTSQVEKLRLGISLDGQPLKEAKVTNVHGARFHIAITEGRNRQIRRMCQKVGLEVVDLRRIKMGPVPLGLLPEGKWRALDPLEVKSLKAAVM